MGNLLDRRLLFIMGKGGVGKSLVSAALARLALKRGKRVLLVQVNTPDKIASYLGCAPAGRDIHEVMPGLFGVNIEPTAAMKEYVLLQVRLEFIYRLVFENRAVKYFLKAVPALNDLVVLGKIYYHVNQMDKKTGRPVYDLVIVDAPPTGHGMFLLELPFVMQRAVKTGPIQREAAGMIAMLQNPLKTAVNFVTLPEEMPVAETAESYEKINRELGLPMGAIFINAVFPRFFEAYDEGRLEQLAQLLGEDPEIAELVSQADTMIRRRRLSDQYVKELARRVPLPEVRLPFMFSDNFGPAETERIALNIEEELASYHGS